MPKSKVKNRNNNLPDSNRLLDYVKGNLKDKEAYRIEREMERNPFFKEAMEGLSETEDEKGIRDSIFLLQQQLKRQVNSRRKREPHPMRPKLWLWVAVVIVILLVFIAWYVIDITI